MTARGKTKGALEDYVNALDAFADRMMAQEDGYRRSQALAEFPDWSDTWLEKVTRALRLRLGESRQWLPCTPQGHRMEWRYRKTSDDLQRRSWLYNRLRDGAKRARTMLADIRSAVNDHGEESEVGRRWRRLYRDLARFIEDLDDLCATETDWGGPTGPAPQSPVGGGPMSPPTTGPRRNRRRSAGAVTARRDTDEPQAQVS